MAITVFLPDVTAERWALFDSFRNFLSGGTEPWGLFSCKTVFEETGSDGVDLVGSGKG